MVTIYTIESASLTPSDVVNNAPFAIEVNLSATRLTWKRALVQKMKWSNLRKYFWR